MTATDANGAQPQYKAWYKTARWQRLRWAVLRRDLFTCKRCKRVKPDTSQLVAHHKVAHKGNERLFWDENNIECFCKGCHDGPVQSFERTGRERQPIGADGWPMA